MGTRSLTFVYDEDTDAIINMYRQYDGYPSGHGNDLHTFLSGVRLVNGLSLNDKEGVANGMGCLAAQLVAHFKKKPGGFYLYPVGATDCGQDYEYHIREDGHSFQVEVCSGGEQLFSGNLEQFSAWIEEGEQ